MAQQMVEQEPTTLILVCCHAIFCPGGTERFRSNGIVGASHDNDGNDDDDNDNDGDHHHRHHRSTLAQNEVSSSQTERKVDPQRDHTDENEANWLIEPFQTGETPTFTAHIREGIRQLSIHQHSLLVFSGGATKPSLTDQTEAAGYLDVARRRLFFLHKSATEHDPKGSCGPTSEEAVGKTIQSRSTDRLNGAAHEERGITTACHELEKRTYVEEWATDSYQNVLLSLVQWVFWKNGIKTGRKALSHDLDQTTRYRQSLERSYEAGSDKTDQNNISSREGIELPKRLIIVSHRFKKDRFLNLHLPAIRDLWPPNLQTQFDKMEVQFIGINPEFNEQKIREIEEGDRKRGYGIWVDDLHGMGNVLQNKRKVRGWDKDDFLRTVGSYCSLEVKEGVGRMLNGQQFNKQ